MDGRNRESAGQEFVRWLGPTGCVIMLTVFVLMLATCFLSGRAPIPGYTPPQSSEYYAAHLDELKTELEKNVFSVMGGVEESRIDGGKLVITISAPDLDTTKAAVLRYYDAGLFEFVEDSK